MVKHDLVILGAGPGGYIAAIRAAQLGMDVACIEKEKALGGTCLRIGCIPSKALLDSSEAWREVSSGGLKAHGVKVGGVELDLKTMMKRKARVVSALTTGVAGLFKKNKVTRYTGHGRIAGAGKVVVETADGKEEIEAEHILIATGSCCAELPGVELDHDRIGTSTEALSYQAVPESLIVIGAGFIGLELGSVWARLGAKVTVLEYLDRILPGVDLELANAMRKILAKQGLSFQLGVKVTGAKVVGDACEVTVDGGDPVTAERVLLAVGRKPVTDDIGLSTVGIEVDSRGRIPVDEHLKTGADGVYAIGDVIEGPMLAHKAEEEGIACVERIATGYGHVNYGVIPGIVYTHPEVAAVGKTEEELKEAGVEFRKGTFPFIANGRARALGETDGMVKILADAGTDRVLGVHIIGPRAGDLIAEAAAAMEYGATSEDIARTCHAHPTLSEVVKEAALAVSGRALHL